MLLLKEIHQPLQLPCVCHKYHGGRLSALTLREMQQEGVWGETQELSLQVLNVYMCRKLSMFHNCEPRIPDVHRDLHQLVMILTSKRFGQHLRY